jgi:triosephosphate isomerase
MPRASSDGGSPPTVRRPLISGNWKMHHNHLEAIQVVQKLSYRLTSEDYAGVDVSVHPAFTALRSIQLLLDDQRIPIALGAQNCHWDAKGAMTGEISVPMLAKLDVVYVIVGHSERRELFGETDAEVRRKIESVIAGGMTPIVCKVTRQVEAALTGLPAEQVAALVVAYEPIWAIGTGRTATPDDAQATIGLIRQVTAGLFDEQVAGRIRIQYGGSVKSSNIGELMDQPDIDGALVGGASLDPDEFARIVQYRRSG